MKHKGKARQAGARIVGWTLVVLLAVLVGGVLALLIGSAITLSAVFLVVFCAVFALVVLVFFRDPDPRVPAAPEAIVAPAHGTVDILDECDEPEFMGGRCRRISIFLSIFDVHVQKAPVAGTVGWVQYHPGAFLNALNLESAARNENVLIGFDSRERPGEKVGVRVIAGVIARRIVPWVAVGEEMARGDRISLVQFGSRCDLYLPLTVTPCVKLGDKVSGGETVVATRA